MRRRIVWFTQVLCAAMIFAGCGSGGGGGASVPSGGGTKAGKNAIVYSVRNAAPANVCPNGGISVDAGIDTNANGVLDPSEVTSTQYVCNGTNGTNGQMALVSVVSEPSGPNCSYGGSKVNVGIDTNTNGSLDSSEVTSSAYICNGANGASGTNGNNGSNGLTTLVSIVTDTTACSNGGLKITSGLDANKNNILEPGEVGSTNYVCNGAPGPAGPTMPVIQSLYVNNSSVSPGGTIMANVTAQSAQGLALAYSWSVSAGWSIASGGTTSTVAITAPATYNTSGTATVTVTDTNGLSAVGAVALRTGGNSAPLIENISVYMYPEPAFTSALLMASVFDANNDPLTCTWKIGGTPLGTGTTVTWQSPGIPGYYLANLDVFDGFTHRSGSAYVPAYSLSPWPKFHRDIQGTGLSPVDTSASTGASKWGAVATGGPVYSSPAIGADGTVYVGSYDGKLYAIRSNGALKWSYTTGSIYAVPISYSSPAIGADGTVYVGDDYANFYAINPDGTLKWSYSGAGVNTSPVIGADGVIYAGGQALNPDGTSAYYFAVDNPSSTPAIGADGTIYVGDGNNLVALYPPGSDFKWFYTTGGTIHSSPAVNADGTIYVGSNDGKLYAINPDGTLKWNYSTGAIDYSSPAIGSDGTIYVGTGTKYIYAIKPDGTLRWRYLAGSYIVSSPAVDINGIVYVGSNDGKLYAINPDGTLKWSRTAGSNGTTFTSSPAIGPDGTIYVGSNTGYILAIQ